MLLLNTQPSTTDSNAQVAVSLAEKAKASRDAGEVVRPYLLYTEAARREPNSDEYSQQRDLLAPVAKLLLKSKLETVSIKREIAIAEHEVAAQREAAQRQAMMQAEVAKRETAERAAAQLKAAQLEASQRETEQAEEVKREIAQREAAELKAAQLETTQREAAQREAAEHEAVLHDAAQAEAAKREIEQRAAATQTSKTPVAAPAADNQTLQEDAAKRSSEPILIGTAAPPPPIKSNPPPPDSNPSPHVNDVKVDKPNAWSFAFGTQILGYGTFDSIRSNSSFNPGNQLAQFPEEDFHAALRPDLKLTNSILSFTAKPRLDYDVGKGTSKNAVNAYLQEWSVRLQVLPSLNISYGREIPMWGPSMSVPASNPFFRDNGRNSPLIEIGARDFGRVVWQPTPRFAISYIANTALRRGAPDFLPFRPTAAVKADYTTNSLLFSGIYSAGISSPFGQRKFVGGYVQATVGQAMRLYVEGSAQQGNPGYFPHDSSPILGLEYSQTKRGNALAPRTIVGGLAYTDPRSNTWTGEYIYNPFGYNSMLAGDFFQTAQGLAGIYQLGGVNSRLAAQELSVAANPGVGPLRRNYGFAQYQRNSLFTHFDLLVRYTLGLDDRSGEGVAYLTWNTNDHLQFYAVFAGMNGSLKTEFARYLRYQAQLGFRIFLP